MASVLASGPSCPGFDSKYSQKNSKEKMLMLLRLNNSAAKVKVGIGLKMLKKTYLVLASGKLEVQK